MVNNQLRDLIAAGIKQGDKNYWDAVHAAVEAKDMEAIPRSWDLWADAVLALRLRLAGTPTLADIVALWEAVYGAELRDETGDMFDRGYAAGNNDTVRQLRAVRA